MQQHTKANRTSRRQWIGAGFAAAFTLPLAAWSQSGLGLVAQEVTEAPRSARRTNDEPASSNARASAASSTDDRASRSQDSAAIERGIVVESATVFADQEVMVPAAVTGRVAQIYVQQNNMIAAQTLIARIDDAKAQIALRLANAGLAAARLEAADDSAIKEAEATLNLATVSRERTESLRSQNVRSEAELELAQLEETQAQLRLDNRRKQLALMQKRLQVSELEVEDATQQVELHKVIAPTAGNVVEIIKQEGEWISEGEPLIKLVNMEWLRVEGTLDNSLFNREEIYMRRVIVEHVRARGEVERFEGVITWEGLREVAGKYIPVRATIRNRTQADHWVLHPGAHVRMVVLDEYGTLAELETTVR